MTGFGVGESTLGAGRVCVEARSVNHRFLELRVRVPRELSDHSVFVEQLLRTRLSRGRVEVVVHWEGAHGGVSLDRARARAALRSVAELAEELGHRGEVPLSLLAAVPDLFVPSVEVDREALRAALTDSIARCVDALDAMRLAEGRCLAADLGARVEAVRAFVGALAGAASAAAPRHRARVRERVQRLLSEARVTVDDRRLEQELALLAEHSDVTEELTRLAAHVDQLAEALSADGPLGRRIDFVLQEMSREANTLGAKSSDVDVGRLVIELKAELERLREQAQNVE